MNILKKLGGVLGKNKTLVLLITNLLIKVFTSGGVSAQVSETDTLDSSFKFEYFEETKQEIRHIRQCLFLNLDSINTFELVGGAYKKDEERDTTNTGFSMQGSLQSINTNPLCDEEIEFFLNSGLRLMYKRYFETSLTFFIGSDLKEFENGHISISPEIKKMWEKTSVTIGTKTVFFDVTKEKNFFAPYFTVSKKFTTSKFTIGGGIMGGHYYNVRDKFIIVGLFGEKNIGDYGFFKFDFLTTKQVEGFVTSLGIEVGKNFENEAWISVSLGKKFDPTCTVNTLDGVPIVCLNIYLKNLPIKNKDTTTKNMWLD